jgi:biopolymer transport protein ExbD
MRPLVLAVALLLPVATAACRRDDRALIRADDAPKARRPRHSASAPSPAPAPSPSSDEHDGAIVLSFELDGAGRVSHRGEPVTNAQIESLVHAAKEAGTVRAEIASDPKASYAAVIGLLDVITKAGVTGLTLKSTGGGPVALTIGSGASLTIGAPADAATPIGSSTPARSTAD